VEGDCEAIERVFVKGELVGAANPWLVIEDAHANVFGVLDRALSAWLQGGYVLHRLLRAERDVRAGFIPGQDR